MTFDFFKNRMNRIIRYFDNLINSFDIMIEGMSREEFTKFRMSLLPGSGFQSFQFRSIEIYSTPINCNTPKPYNTPMQRNTKRRTDLTYSYEYIPLQ